MVPKNMGCPRSCPRPKDKDDLWQLFFLMAKPAQLCDWFHADGQIACILPEWRNRGLNTIEMRPLLDLLDLQTSQRLDRHVVTSRLTPDILDLAYDLRHRRSTDPRDKIFSLIGLVEDTAPRELIQPDYSLSLDEMYEILESSIRFCLLDCKDISQHSQRCLSPPSHRPYG